MGIEWEIPRGLRSFFWVLVSSRSGNNKKKSGVTQVIMGNGKRKSVYKNDLMQHGECVLHKVVILFTFERFSECLSLPFFGVQRMPRVPKNIYCHRENKIFSRGQLFISCPSHNIPIKPYTSPLSFQLQLLIGRGHFSTNFLPIILHENPSIFPASPFLFISLFSSPSSHLTSSATRNYEIQRDPLQLLLCSHFLLPTVKLGIGK